MPSPFPVYIGISQCLLGDPVRYDGGHKRSAFCTDMLAPFVEYVAICPEMAIGLGAPRQPVHLQATGSDIRLRGKQDARIDITDAMQAFALGKAGELGLLSGYVFKSKSPSCGLYDTPVFAADGAVARTGPGLYAEAIRHRHPLLPVEDENCLQEPLVRDHFLTRVFALHRWQTLLQQGLSLAGLQDFHARHKYLLMAYRQDTYRSLGPQVAEAPTATLEQVAAAYIGEFMAALGQPASRGAHGNALQHMAGYLKRKLPATERQALHALIQRYQQGDIPLGLPLARLREYFRQYPDTYIAGQVYLEPYPAALMPAGAPAG